MIPVFEITDLMLDYIVKISELTTLLSLEQRDLHLRKENRIRSIQSSLAIENNGLSLEQVTDIINGKKVLGAPKEIHEVQNAYDAYEYVFTLNPYDVKDFLKAHASLTQGLVKHPGEFRYGDVGVYDENNTLIHMGARPQFVPNLVEELFEWAKSSSIPDLIKSCVVHFELEIIHPFEDGNGRMGRLWQNLILSQWQTLFEWLPIETVIYKHQESYYKTLAISNQKNNSTPFIEFILEAILETLQEYSLKGVSDKTSDKMSDKEEKVLKQVQEYLASHDFIRVKDLQALTALSPASARRYLVKFTQLDLLDSKGSNRDRRYQLKEKS